METVALGFMLRSWDSVHVVPVTEDVRFSMDRD